MIKSDETTEPLSCWNKARDDERVFILLARDVAAPETLRFWAHHRIALGKNARFDRQIVDALDCADRMEEEAKVIDYRAPADAPTGDAP